MRLSRMPRYFFHGLDSDEEGCELPDASAACAAARETFGELIRGGEIIDGGLFEVVDETGRRIIKLSFSAEAAG
jgi:hypothetical protein